MSREFWRQVRDALTHTGPAYNPAEAAALHRTVTAERKLALAHEFRVPLTNQAGGYGEVVVQRGEGPHRSRWAVTDGSVTLLHTWTGEDWQPVREIGATAAYRHTLDEALAVAHQVAEIEGACTEAQANALHPEL